MLADRAAEVAAERLDDIGMRVHDAALGVKVKAKSD